MTARRRSAVLGVLLLVAGCGAEPAEPPPLPRAVPVAQRVPADMAALVAGIDAFGLDLLTAPTLAAESNLVVSPVSVSVALQLVGAGAVGQTAAQIDEVLHLPVGSRPRLPAFAVRMSNTAWAQDGLRLEPAYETDLRDRFGTRLRRADFVADPDGARHRINDTVADQTAGRITDLFPPNAISADTRLVLTNAVHLKADWARAFPADRTRQEPFTRGDGTTVSVPMMHNDVSEEPPVHLGYAEGPGHQAVTVPYEGGELAFTVIIPEDPEALRGQGIAAILASVRPAPVALAMPRFTVKSALDLSETLRDAGMPLAFTADADLSGITDDVDLRIDSVQHKTWVQVDEKGTEAAAATGADVHAVSAPVVRVVTVDRPFVFVITDTSTGAPLFLGRIADPTAG